MLFNKDGLLMKNIKKNTYLLMLLTSLLVCSAKLSGRVTHDPFVIHAIPKCGTHYIERVIALLVEKSVFNRELSDESLSVSENTNRILRIFSIYEHSAMSLLINREYKVIAMHRDPRDALISLLFYMRSYAGKGKKRDFFTVGENFDSLSFDDQLSALILGSNGTESYTKLYKSRIKWTLNSWSLPVKYEDLIGDDDQKVRTIYEIADYIGMELTPEKLQYVLDNMYKKDQDITQDGKVFTRASSGNWRVFFKPEHKKIFKKKLGDLLIKLGYEKNSHW